MLSIEVSTPDATRRTSYGRASPHVGERGARTRALITDEALRSLGSRGAYETTVDDIASAAGVSRAAFYQYFESKEHVFAELAEESGAALLRVLRHLGPLGADAAGFEQMAAWMAQWVLLYRRYANVFAQWSAIGSTFSGAGPMIGKWIGNYVDRVTPLISPGGSSTPELEQFALGVWSVFERYCFVRRSVGDDRGTAADLAVVAQLMLFPETRPGVLSGGHVARASDDTEDLRIARGRGAGGRADRLADLGPGAQRTGIRLLDSAGRIFAAYGFYAASVDQVATAAGVGRGTFYKYFTDKTDLLRVLTVDCADDMEEIAAALMDVAGDGSADRLEEWLSEFLLFHDTYAGVWRVWTDDPVLCERLPESGLRAQDALAGALVHLVKTAGRSYPPVSALASMLHGLLQRFPDQATGTRFELADGRKATVIAQLIGRAFLTPG